MNVYEDPKSKEKGLKDEFDDLAKQHKVSAQIKPWQGRVCYILCVIFEWTYYLRWVGLVFLMFAAPVFSYQCVEGYTGGIFWPVLSIPFSYVAPFVYWVIVEAFLRTLTEYIFFYTDKLPVVKNKMDYGTFEDYQQRQNE